MSTSIPILSKIHKNQRGLTLIEIMIVLVIVAGFFALALPALNDKKRELRSEIRKFKVLARSLRAKARVSNTTYRIVIEMPEERAEDPTHKFWVEASSERVTIMTEDQKKDLESELAEDKDIDNLFGFALDESFFKEPKELPDGLKFSRVEYTDRDDPIREGKAFIHFFPSGLVEESAIHISGLEGEMNFTISFHPLTGNADIIFKDVELKDLVAQ